MHRPLHTSLSLCVCVAAIGAHDSWLVASCGVAPAGRLVRARMGAALAPYMADGPHLPVRALHAYADV